MAHPVAASIQAVCVYCGSRAGVRPEYAAAATALGVEIGKAGLTLVYGAGSVGLMGITARAAIKAGSPVIGIIPEHLNDIEITQDGLSETHVTANMHDRKRMMFEKSDAFIIMPGGLGTLDETFEIMTWAQLSLHKKPIILVNINGYWDPFITLLETITREGFAGPEHINLITVVTTVEDAVSRLCAAQPQAFTPRPDLF